MPILFKLREFYFFFDVLFQNYSRLLSDCKRQRYSEVYIVPLYTRSACHVMLCIALLSYVTNSIEVSLCSRCGRPVYEVTDTTEDDLHTASFKITCGVVTLKGL